MQIRGIQRERYLLRNPGLSFVAVASDALVGCVMSGHDGRRGYLQHLMVLPSHRNQGIASSLVENCLGGLERLGILKSHIDVFQTNTLAQHYWGGAGAGSSGQISGGIHLYALVGITPEFGQSLIFRVGPEIHAAHTSCGRAAFRPRSLPAIFQNWPQTSRVPRRSTLAAQTTSAARLTQAPNRQTPSQPPRA